MHCYPPASQVTSAMALLAHSSLNVEYLTEWAALTWAEKHPAPFGQLNLTAPEKCVRCVWKASAFLLLYVVRLKMPRATKMLHKGREII